MWDEATNAPHTAHTTNPVPCVVIGYDSGPLVEQGKLADIAPTILTMLGLEVPEQMSGEVLFGK